MKSTRSALLALALGSLACPPFASLEAAERAAMPRIDVILWFDTEDYLLPADDDAAKRLAEMLTERKIRATFKVVGEKARVLEKRGRRDVIAALRKHDIGYHSDFHSVHPTPSEYLADCGLLDGIAEFTRREGDGAADVRRIFGVKTLSCYGQPGSSWGAQAIAALPQIGVAPADVGCYVDEGNQVGLNNKPFWYAGAINVFSMGRGKSYTRMELHDPAAVEPAEKEVSAMAERLAKEGGGIISIFYHPCEWVHQQFWDGVNFSRGANPPREQWKPPAQRSAQETEAAFQRFGQYVDYLRSIPGVRFITASELPSIYSDPVRSEGVTLKEMFEMARGIMANTNGVDFQIISNKSFSVADQFELLTLTVAGLVDTRERKSNLKTGAQFPLRAHGLLGPDGPPPTNAAPIELAGAAFTAAVLDTREFIQTHHRVPARVFIGAEKIAPADFLTALASIYTTRIQQGPIAYRAGTAVLPERYVAKDTPNLFGGWVIHKEGFRAPKILEVARLQAWTLKPALRKN
jgi:hypothetical protein